MPFLLVIEVLKHDIFVKSFNHINFGNQYYAIIFAMII